MNGFMHKTDVREVTIFWKELGRLKNMWRPGFTLLEVLFVIVLIGFMLAALSPVLFRPRPGYQRAKFVDELSNLIADGYLGALELGVLHRVVFDIEKNEVRVEKSTQKKDIQGNVIFEQLTGDYLTTQLQWPENLEIENFYVNRKEELLSGPSVQMKKIWFFITPDGMSQEVTINILDKNDITAQGKSAEMSLVINPFTVQLQMYEIFQRP